MVTSCPRTRPPKRRATKKDKDSSKVRWVEKAKRNYLYIIM